MVFDGRTTYLPFIPVLHLQTDVYGPWQELAHIKEADRYALGPGSSSGHYSRKLRSALGYSKSKDLYELDVPGHSKHDLSRTLHTISCLPAHEQFATDVANDVSCRNKLAELIRDESLPPCYYEHKVVKDNPGELVLPIALYIDGVPFSQTDSVLGWWLVNLVSGQRYLYGLLRKSTACRCGCRGYCSFHMFFPSRCGL